jgi:signal transduction histidine kinase
LRDIIDHLDRLGIAAAELEENRRFVSGNASLQKLLDLNEGEGVGVDFGAVLAGKAKDLVTVGLSMVHRFADQASWYRLDLKSLDRGFVGILTDVGREYDPKGEIQHYNLTRDRLLHDAKIGTWRYDPDRELYYFSSELSLGHEGAGSAVPVTLLQLLQHPDDKDKDTAIRERITREGGTANAEMRYREADGSWTHLDVHYRSGRRLESGRYEMYGISQNITAVASARDEASQLSAQLQVALRDADYANRTKTEFLANMSHELRTPLNAILGFSELIETQLFGPVPGKYVGYAHDIHRSGQHLLQLVNDVLDLSKLEAGKLELRESELDLPELINDCFSLVRGKADEGRVRLLQTPDAEVTGLRGDPRTIKQILLNFLSNAVKFTPAGGTVTVVTSRDEAGRACLSVRDTGIGMSERDLAVALSPFGQIDSAMARKHQGTGLGLSICKSLMELHGGDVLLQSTQGVGTTITARFPRERVVLCAAA